jgi:pimeloyl-ACP methyl ester carboxylesterase
VADALDHVRTFARARHLDLSRVVVVGHSAGGHLAMWAASRHRLPTTSRLYKRNPLRFRQVFDLAGGPDMAAYLAVEQQACSDDVVEQMMGGKPKGRAVRYRQSSASRMLPLGIRQTIVWGSRDTVVPEALGTAYVAKARRSGDRVEMLSFPAAGHFEIASPLEDTWPRLRSKIISALGEASHRR